MNLISYAIAACLALLFSISSAPALEINKAFADLTETFEQMQKVVREERRALVEKNMQLNETEGEKFWPLYDQYRGEIDKVNSRLYTIITDYAAAYPNLTNRDAQSMLDEWLTIQKKVLKIRKDYVAKFRRVLAQRKVTRFYQVENKLDAIMNFDLARKIPLVE